MQNLSKSVKFGIDFKRTGVPKKVNVKSFIVKIKGVLLLYIKFFNTFTAHKIQTGIFFVFKNK